MHLHGTLDDLKRGLEVAKWVFGYTRVNAPVLTGSRPVSLALPLPKSGVTLQLVAHARVDQADSQARGRG